MSGWDDLFALAAGDKEINDPNQSLTNENELQSQSINQVDNAEESKKKKRLDNDSFQSRKKKKKRKKKMKHFSRKASPRQCLEILASRMYLPKTDTINSTETFSLFPPWMKCGSTIIKTYTSFASKNNTTNENNNDEATSLSPLHHMIQLSDDAEESISSLWKNVLNLFLSIRNIRVCPSCIVQILHSSSQHKQRAKLITTIQSYAKSSHHQSQKLQSLLNNIISSTTLFSFTSPLAGEGQLLKDKCQKLLQSSQRLHSKAQQLTKETKHIPGKPAHPSIFIELFEEIVTLIIDCDSFYFRLYYIQITHLLQFAEVYNHDHDDDDDLNAHNSAAAISRKIAFIPHPSTYFGVPCMSWDISQGLQYIQDIIKEIMNEFGVHTKLSSRMITKQNVLKLLSKLPESTKKSQVHFMVETASKFNFLKNDDGTISTCDHDPLSFLHNNRLLEGLILFHKSDWFTSNRAKEQTIQSLKTHHQRLNNSNHDKPINTEEDLFYARHETPAPTILIHWRDSCRNFLCNLYAYATLAPNTIHQIKKFCERNEISEGLVEVGAGTGFVAELIHRSGIKINAWDVSPPSSTSNDYHGQTPSFVTVRKGNVDDALKHHFNSCNSNQSAELSALLLCYPPPNSDMAYQAAKLFLKFRGRYIIHIGEFKGLTGSNKFEAFLKTSFVCQARYPCLEWGNDASNVTIWFRKEKSKKTNNNHNTRETSNKPETVLLPCSYCHENESVRRYRLSRTIVYCSLKCFQSHTTLRNQLLQFHFMNVLDRSGKEEIEFENDQHFMKLT